MAASPAFARISASSTRDAAAALQQVLELAGEVLLGKDRVIRLTLTCLLARGHLLIEDIPGVGKTTLALLLTRLLGLSFVRLQFTSDLLPADILGCSVYHREEEAFRFHPGPVFHQVVMADEINRATPRVQSALLEAMEETQVTIDGQRHPLPRPFFLIATQNPGTQIGTYALPESQLDRFTMCLALGHPDQESERRLLRGKPRRQLIEDLKPPLPPERLAQFQQAVSQVRVESALLDYLLALLRYTRESGRYGMGLSPRAGLRLLDCARAWALLHERDIVLPEDLQQILPAVAVHRLQQEQSAVHDKAAAEKLVSELLHRVPIP